MKITEILLALDHLECGYRLVELDTGETAFVWGNIPCDVGDSISAASVESSTDEKGVKVYSSVGAAMESWRDCAEALNATTSGAGRKMLELAKGL